MISIAGTVSLVVTLIVVAVILALLWALIGFCEGRFPQVPMAWNIIRVIFVIIVVVLLISILLSLANPWIGGNGMFRP